ncbi:hypothetical protein CLV59_109157 [Chitinophaga dinghuensis]|uniref:Uncharacterized protein n=1 Tax=Chitinophaga dinghuensis TaxID=1539050 RepID=A0A327VNY5_9BACT|nr:hypothetical protein [Chitinophaga dinghuensis]RAJ75543.1 hypothetical protein CLV59_109157 [Chitinophaga dinghuensis]
MPIQDRNKLKSWFETGDYPTQQQFWDLIDSFFHKLEDVIDINNVSGLRTLLNAKADYEQLQSHLGDKANPHAVTKAQVGLSNIPNNISDAIDLNQNDTLATSAAVFKLASKIGNNTIEEQTFTTNGRYVLRLGDLLEKIVVIPTADISLSIGTVSGGNDILDALPLSGNAGNVISLDLFAASTDKDVYFSGIAGSVQIRYYKR